MNTEKNSHSASELDPAGKSVPSPSEQEQAKATTSNKNDDEAMSYVMKDYEDIGQLMKKLENSVSSYSNISEQNMATISALSSLNEIWKGHIRTIQIMEESSSNLMGTEAGENRDQSTISAAHRAGDAVIEDDPLIFI